MSAPTRRELLQKMATATAAGTVGLGVMERLLVPPAMAGSSMAGGGAKSSGTPKAYVNFAINVQNFRYLNSSAEVVGKLCEIFQKYGVKGDFYLTEVMTRRYNADHPGVISALKGQGICYHVRPPHPIFNGFDSRLESVSGEELRNRIAKYETEALNLQTGEFNEKSTGGFRVVKSTFGRAPSTVGCPNDNAAIKTAVCEYYKDQGAQAVVWTHGATEMGDNPYTYRNGLLARPCDYYIDEWSAAGEKMLWWNRFKDGNPGEDCFPANRIRSRIAVFDRPRPAYVVAVIHDNNFTRRGGDPWLYTYWKDEAKTEPRSPPYNLDADDPSSARSEEERSRIYKAYEQMVQYCAENYSVVTMADIVAMAS